MMQGKSAILSYHASKNCFVNLPRSWTSKLPREKVAVFELQSSGGSLYTSWAGGTTTIHDNGVDGVEINGLFAIKQSVNHGDVVLLSQIATVSPCTQVYVEPVDITDWEILEDNAEYIETNLLSQVQAVWIGQIIPIWVQKSICIFVKIGKTVPSSKCCLLEENTEVIVAPKARNAQRRKETKSSSKPSKGQNNSDETEESTKQEDDSRNDTLVARKQRTRNLSGRIAADLKKAATNYDNEVRPLSAGASKKAGISGNQADQKEVSVIKPIGFVARSMSYVRSWWPWEDSSEKQCLSKAKPSENHYVKEYLTGDMDCNLRVQSLDHISRHLTNIDSVYISEDSRNMLLRQPANVIMSIDTFAHHFSNNVDVETPKFFLATVTKLISPLEKEEVASKQSTAPKAPN